jgi:hypothetical protein
MASLWGAAGGVSSLFRRESGALLTRLGRRLAGCGVFARAPEIRHAGGYI